MDKKVPEKKVQKSVINHLREKGWDKNSIVKKLTERGVDIEVTNNDYGRKWLIECKGDASENTKAHQASRESNFRQAFGQIITRMETKGDPSYRYGTKYGIAFTAAYKDMVERRIHYSVCYKLTLSFFFVDSKGNVEEHNWKTLKNLNRYGVKKRKVKTIV